MKSGTLFLDEIGELPITMQADLLRVLQHGEFKRVGGNTLIKVNVRIVAATNRNLQEAIKTGRFLRICSSACCLPLIKNRTKPRNT